MPFCAIKYCRNNSSVPNNNNELSFHRFPRDEILRNKWIDVVRESRGDAKWTPVRYSVVCSLHFKESEKYMTKSRYHVLLKHVVPSEKLSIVNNNQNSIIEVLNDTVDEEVEDTSLNIDSQQCLQPVACKRGPEIELLEAQLLIEMNKFLEVKLEMKRKIDEVEQRIQILTKKNIFLKTKVRRFYAM